MNLSAYQRNVLRQAGINPDVAEAIANAERQPDPFMGAFDREPQWSDAEHELRALTPEKRAEAAQERHTMFTALVKIALDECDPGWRGNTFDGEAASAAQTIRYVFEALGMYREASLKANRDMVDMKRDWELERINARMEDAKRWHPWRTFKRLFESIKAWERERWDKRWK